MSADKDYQRSLSYNPAPGIEYNNNNNDLDIKADIHNYPHLLDKDDVIENINIDHIVPKLTNDLKNIVISFALEVKNYIFWSKNLFEIGHSNYTEDHFKYFGYIPLNNYKIMERMNNKNLGIWLFKLIKNQDYCQKIFDTHYFHNQDQLKSCMITCINRSYGDILQKIESRFPDDLQDIIDRSCDKIFKELIYSRESEDIFKRLMSYESFHDFAKDRIHDQRICKYSMANIIHKIYHGYIYPEFIAELSNPRNRYTAPELLFDHGIYKYISDYATDQYFAQNIDDKHLGLYIRMVIDNNIEHLSATRLNIIMNAGIPVNNPLILGKSIIENNYLGIFEKFLTEYAPVIDLDQLVKIIINHGLNKFLKVILPFMDLVTWSHVDRARILQRNLMCDTLYMIYLTQE